MQEYNANGSMHNSSVTSGPVLGFTVLRCITGVNMFTHGLVRLIGEYHGFAQGMAQGFSETFLPFTLVKAFGYFLVPFEFIIGILLVIGLATRWSLVGGGLLMAAFTFGQCLRQNWSAAGTIMVYGLVFSVLLFAIKYNIISIDNALFQKTERQL